MGRGTKLGKAVEIRIRDNGIGFTTKPAGKERLRRFDDSRHHCQAIGGRIDVETEPSAFTQFIVTLPRDNGQPGGLSFE